MLNATEKFHAINAAYARGDFVKAKALIDGLLEVAPDSPQGLSARYLRARGYEDGHFDGIDLDKALEDFEVLAQHAELYGSDGMLGCARVLFEQDHQRNKDKAVGLLKAAVELDSNVKAMMVLGRVYEEGFDDAASAGMWYLLAYKQGLPWGLRYYARLQSKNGNWLRAALAHLIATLSSPILVLKHGVRSPFK